MSSSGDTSVLCFLDTRPGFVCRYDNGEGPDISPLGSGCRADISSNFFSENCQLGTGKYGPRIIHIKTNRSMKKHTSLRFKSYVSENGTLYHIPVGNRQPGFLFFSLPVYYNENGLAADKLLEPGTDGPYSLTVGVDSFVPSPHCPNQRPVTLLLYREGDAEPLSVRTVEEGQGELELWSDPACLLEPGDYFLLVENAEPPVNLDNVDRMGHCTRLPFRILRHGSQLVCPALSSATALPRGGLTLHLAPGQVTTEGLLQAVAFDSTGRIVFRQEDVPYHPATTEKVSLPVRFDQRWPDDTYTYVLLYNEEPFARVSFRWTEDTAANLVMDPVEKGSSLYWRARLTFDESSWTDLSAVCGCSDVLEGVLRRKSAAAAASAPHFAVAGPSDIVSGLAGSLACLLVPNGSKDLYGCDDLLEGLQQGRDVWELPFGWPATERRVCCLERLSALLSGEGKELLEELEGQLQSDPDFRLMLFGTSEELSELFRRSPVLAACIPAENRWAMCPYTLNERYYELVLQLEDYGLRLSSGAKEELCRLLKEGGDRLAGYGRAEIAHWAYQEIVPRFRHRLAFHSQWRPDGEYFQTIEAEDLCLPGAATLPADDFAAVMAELEGMVGLTELKRQLVTTFNRTRFEERRRRFGLSVHERGGHHLLFTGNPGTGKTTVARLVGRVFHSMGLLSKGEVIEAERSTMVGRYIGETEQKMQELLERSKGNVLFIDEAYSLCDNSDGDRKDFGCRVLECLLTALAEKNPDRIIILAGYEKEMDRMLEMNPGMKGRFPYRFHFADYTADELVEIALRLFARNDYTLTAEAAQALREVVAQVVASKDAFFHNARWVEQFVWDGIVAAMSDRVMALETDMKECYQTVEAADVLVGYRRTKPAVRKQEAVKRRIGFVA